ncbi:hypothetical protein Tco_0860639 [Tanacetum coccineum]|uniref:Uncharacterized protein n=1 Tax=Tanacetum coccineum TaxID=301880 RepID=A0ABQ5BII1_9ASTR
MSSSTVTYMSVYSDSDPWRFQWVSDDEPEAPQSLEQAPPSPDYMPGPEHPPSPDYVPGLEHPPSLDYVPDPEYSEYLVPSDDEGPNEDLEEDPAGYLADGGYDDDDEEEEESFENYVPGPEYPEYLVPSDDEVPIEDQPLPADASPTTLSSGYLADSDPEEDPKEDLAEYPADGGGDEDDDDDDDKEEEEEEEEEEEHLALADSTTKDTKAFKTVESAPTPPRSPRLRRARIFVRPQSPMAASTEALIVEYAAAPTPPSPPPSPLTPLSSLLP